MLAQSLKNTAWPAGQVCAVTVTIDLDGESVDLHEAPRQILSGRYSYGRYAMRAGIWRLLDLLKAHDLRATCFVPAWDAEQHPEVMEALAAGGHEIAAHGYQHEDHGKLGDRERELLERAHRSLERITGNAPVGWRAPAGLLSPSTLAYLAELGYLYDSSFHDDDFPYVMDVGGRRLVELPKFAMLDDATLYRVRQPQDRVLKTWLEELDAIYSEQGYVNLTLHPRGDAGSGRATRVRAVDEFLTGVERLPGAVFMTCRELASWWLDHHPEGEPAP